MRLHRGFVWTTAALALTLVFAKPGGPADMPSTSAAQKEQTKSSVTQEGRYYVYVKGIT